MFSKVPGGLEFICERNENNESNRYCQENR